MTYSNYSQTISKIIILLSNKLEDIRYAELRGGATRTAERVGLKSLSSSKPSLRLINKNYDAKIHYVDAE